MRFPAESLLQQLLCCCDKVMYIMCMPKNTFLIRGELIPAASAAADYGADLDLATVDSVYDYESPEHKQLVLLRELTPEVMRSQGYDVDTDGNIHNANEVSLATIANADVSRFDLEVSPLMARKIGLNARVILENEKQHENLIKAVLNRGPRQALEQRRKSSAFYAQLAELATLDIVRD